MIVDSSAIVAIVLGEPEAAEFFALMRASEDNSMSTASYVEVGVVIDRRTTEETQRKVERLLTVTRVRLSPVTEAQAKIARSAYQAYGKGSGHPAQLNFGDCFAYALAVDTDEPLLYKGDDFTHTDVRRAR